MFSVGAVTHLVWKVEGNWLASQDVANTERMF